MNKMGWYSVLIMAAGAMNGKRNGIEILTMYDCCVTGMPRGSRRGQDDLGQRHQILHVQKVQR